MATDFPQSHEEDEIWHALLHDLRGAMGGLKATLDLREPGGGVDARDAHRMETVVREGLAMLELARALAFGPWPEGACEPAESWGRRMESDLMAVATSFRGTIQFTLKQDSPWPGALLRLFILSLARLVMPQALPDPLSVEASTREDVWVLRFHPVLAPPLALQPEGQARDLHGLWVRAVARRCAMSIDHAGDCLTLAIPRGPKGLPPVE